MFLCYIAPFCSNLWLCLWNVLYKYILPALLLFEFYRFLASMFFFCWIISLEHGLNCAWMGSFEIFLLERIHDLTILARYLGLEAFRPSDHKHFNSLMVWCHLQDGHLPNSLTFASSVHLFFSLKSLGIIKICLLIYFEKCEAEGLHVLFGQKWFSEFNCPINAKFVRSVSWCHELWPKLRQVRPENLHDKNTFLQHCRWLEPFNGERKNLFTQLWTTVWSSFQNGVNVCTITTKLNFKNWFCSFSFGTKNTEFVFPSKDLKPDWLFFIRIKRENIKQRKENKYLNYFYPRFTQFFNNMFFNFITERPIDAIIYFNLFFSPFGL